MKVIFLDFDGVLNSEASFHMEFKKKKRNQTITKINETLSEVACSNFQMILDAVPEAQVVISSAWRVFFTLDWLKAHLTYYGIDGKRVMGVTGRTLSGHRGREIREYLEDLEERIKEPVEYIIIDDSVGDLQLYKERLIATTWKDGLLLGQAAYAAKLLGGKLMNEKELCAQDDALDEDLANIRRSQSDGVQNPEPGV